MRVLFALPGDDDVTAAEARDMRRRAERRIADAETSSKAEVAPACGAGDEEAGVVHIEMIATPRTSSRRPPISHITSPRVTSVDSPPPFAILESTYGTRCLSVDGPLGSE